MRIGLALSVVAALGGFALVAQDRAPAPARDLVVHEWGTFTSMQGSDGVTLEGLQHEEEALPDFVYSRTEVRECPLRDKGYKGLEVDVEKVTKKMETPVTYFYGPPGRVRVRVCFNQGLLTQWYPVSDLLGPPEGDRDAGPLDMAKVDKSTLEWEVDVLPKGEGLGDVPDAGRDHPWNFARIPDANCVRTVPRKEPRLGPTETEKFLFYRGLGRFTLPLRAVTERGSTVTLHNDGATPVRHVIAFHVDGAKASIDYCPAVAARGSVTFTVPARSEKGPVISKVMDVLRRQLVAEGLTEKEAEAMVKTWERSYFHTEGLRVLYVVPREVTDAVLPIAIEPRPKELVRVLVGRLECLTPESEDALEAALRDGASEDASTRAAAEARLERLGRFLEPYLRRVLAKTGDEAVKKEARKRLER